MFPRLLAIAAVDNRLPANSFFFLYLCEIKGIVSRLPGHATLSNHDVYGFD